MTVCNLPVDTAMRCPQGRKAAEDFITREGELVFCDGDLAPATEEVRTSDTGHGCYVCADGACCTDDDESSDSGLAFLLAPSDEDDAPAEDVGLPPHVELSMLISAQNEDMLGFAK